MHALLKGCDAVRCFIAADTTTLRNLGGNSLCDYWSPVSAFRSSVNDIVVGHGPMIVARDRKISKRCELYIWSGRED